MLLPEFISIPHCSIQGLLTGPLNTGCVPQTRQPGMHIMTVWAAATWGEFITLVFYVFCNRQGQEKGNKWQTLQYFRPDVCNIRGTLLEAINQTTSLLDSTQKLLLLLRSPSVTTHHCNHLYTNKSYHQEKPRRFVVNYNS